MCTRTVEPFLDELMLDDLPSADTLDLSVELTIVVCFASFAGILFRFKISEDNSGFFISAFASD